MNIEGTTRDGKQIISEAELKKELQRNLAFEAKSDLTVHSILFILASALGVAMTLPFFNMARNVPGVVSVAAAILVPIFCLAVLVFYAYMVLVSPIHTIFCLSRREIILTTDRVCGRDTLLTNRGMSEIGILYFTEGGSMKVSMDDYRRSGIGDEYYIFTFNTKKRQVLYAFPTEKYLIK